MDNSTWQNMTVGPAYGKDYKSRAAALAAWEDDHDFRIEGMHPDAGRYVNKSDAERFSPGITVTIRYKRMTMSTTVKVAVPEATASSTEGEIA